MLSFVQASAGQTIDAELEALRVRVATAEAELAALDPSSSEEILQIRADLSAINVELAALQAQVAATVPDALITDLRADVDFALLEIESAFNEIDLLSPDLDPVVVENLNKRLALNYMRIIFLESATDPTGDNTRCWNTGGTPDRDLGTCVCPILSSWVGEDDPATERNEIGCTWDDPSSGDPDLWPIGELVDPDPIPPACEPGPEVPTGENCVWNTTTCIWDCPDPAAHTDPTDPTVCEPTEPNPDVNTCSWNFKTCAWVCS
ncbi:MAG: hypothetical protein ACW987_15335 [Candidatus Thorarchaeota archaeon]